MAGAALRRVRDPVANSYLACRARSRSKRRRLKRSNIPPAKSEVRPTRTVERAGPPVKASVGPADEPFEVAAVVVAAVVGVVVAGGGQVPVAPL